MSDGQGQDFSAVARELEVLIRSLEVRIRVLEQKQIQGEGELKNLLMKTDLQITKLVSDSDVEKEARRMENSRLEKSLKEASEQSDTLAAKVDGINNKIVWATGAMAAILFLVDMLAKHFLK